MDTLSIDRLEVRYRMPLSRAGEADRLDRALRRMLDETLESALERAGFRATEEVCIRQVEVPVRLRLSADDDDLILAWSDALARGLRQAVAKGETSWVVRYTSRSHALLDLAAGAAAGDLRRAWAWRQLGLGPQSAGSAVQEIRTRSEAAEAFATALAAEPETIVPILHAVAETGHLERIAVLLPPEIWVELAREALRVAGAPVEVLTGEELFGGDEEGIQKAASPDLKIARRMIADSPIGRMAHRISAPRTVPALAALAVLDADPGFAHRSVATWRAVLAAVAHSVEALSETPRPQTAREGIAETISALDPAARSEAVEMIEDDRPLLDVRREGFTQFGGLLFLVGLVEELGGGAPLPAEGGAMGEGSGVRSLRWHLHQLGLALVPAAPADPAVLAFAGLPPESQPPSEGEDPPSPEEQAVLASWVERIAAALAVRLHREDTQAAELLAAVCRRRARIVADPGWIEVHLSLDEVAVDVRRAGLDLDPGWVPWLGVVLRFRYE
jgi:hypothetical protein